MIDTVSDTNCIIKEQGVIDTVSVTNCIRKEQGVMNTASFSNCIIVCEYSLVP